MAKIISIILFLFILGSSKAQNTADYTTNLNHIALSVTDVNQAANFYKKILNLKEITNRTEVEGIRWFSFGEEKELHLISTLKGKVITNRAVHFALSTSDFDAFLQKLKSFNIEYSDWPGTKGKIQIRADGARQVYFQDPDGYWIEMNSIENSGTKS
ncbi:VOC family protein [Robertkochia solimangrovi]|uniref:VOC family protein n=1 Tax=Robertkochia solimangrovi TaxID=2213046 RepID=UPI0011814C40|nr:VOC family protein [Robertkochia solimangrovi]TRZ46322.1 VOC family protein [Robertkochia solimangrovi]